MVAQTAKPARQLASLSVAAEYADVSPRTLRRRIADGSLPAYRVGKLVKVDLNDLERIVTRIPTGGAAR